MNSKPQKEPIVCSPEDIEKGTIFARELSEQRQKIISEKVRRIFLPSEDDPK